MNAAPGGTLGAGGHAGVGGTVGTNGGRVASGGSDTSLGGNGNSEGGSGGDFGASNAGATASCEAPLADCDASTFTPCETDTSSSSLHCGACSSKCFGACWEGSCLDPVALVEQLMPSERGWARVGSDWYALSDGTLTTFREGQAVPKLLLADLPNVRVIEAAPDRLYLGAETHWFSVRFSAPGTLIDENVDALDAKYMDGALYWVDSAGLVHVRVDGAGTGLAYCALPAPAFHLDAVRVARLAPGVPVIFRRGYGEQIHSDVVTCPAPGDDVAPLPVSGSLVAEAGETLHVAAGGESVYWHDGERLYSADLSGNTELRFTVSDSAMQLGPLLVVESALFLGFERDYAAGLLVLDLNSRDAPRALGTWRVPRALYFDADARRLCFGNEYAYRPECLELATLVPPSDEAAAALTID